MMYSRVYVEITNICNRSCSFCPSHRRSPQRMSAEDFGVITDKLSGLTEYLYYHVMGEPLTHPLLPTFIEIAARKGYRSVVTTNGTLLARVGDRLIDSGVYKVNISVHSFEGDSKEALGEYVGTCLDFADKASRRGVLVILRLWNNGFDEGRNQEILRLAKNRFCDGEWVSEPRGVRIRHRLHLEFGDRFAWPDMGEDDGGDEVFCYGLSDHFSVLCDGTVVPCCLDRNGDMSLGNILNEDIKDILLSKRAVNICEGFKKRVATEELCHRCGYARRFR